MSSLTVLIKSCQVRQKQNYFIVAQLDEIEYPDKHKISQKFRTDLAHYTEYLRFQKNIFKFVNLSLGNRLILKLGCFQTTPDIDINDTNSLLKNSQLYGSGSYVLTQSFITKLRRKEVLEQEMKLFDQENIKEMGSITLVYKLKIESFEDQVYEDNREIEKYYYDPYNNDNYEIQKNVSKIQKLVNEKNDQMTKKYDELDKRNQAMRTLAVDLAYLRKTNNDLITENDKMNKKITQLTNVEEVHIEIDVLSQTKQGQHTLKEKYAKFIKRYELEKRRYDGLQKEYFKIEPSLQQIQKLNTQIEEVKQAGDEQEFYFNRYKDQANRVKAQKETILSQEEIITNLAYSVKTQMKEGPQQSQDLEIKLNDMKYKRERLMERLKQLKLLINMNDGSLPREYQERIKDEEIEENKEEVKRLRQRQDQLLEQIQQTSREIDALGPRQNEKYYRSEKNFYDVGRQEWEEEKKGLNQQFRFLERRSNQLSNEITLKTFNQAKIISDLQYQIQQFQNKIDEKAQLLF